MDNTINKIYTKKDNYTCIYMIENIINKKKYVGATINFYRRYREHLLSKTAGVMNISSAIKEYGSKNFIFTVLEIIDDKNGLGEREFFWMNKYNTLNEEYGYNSQYPLTVFGKKMSENSKKKLSDTIMALGNRKKELNSFFNKTHTAESKLKMSIARKLRVTKPETREKLSLSKKGVKQSREHAMKRALSRKNNGYVMSIETIEKRRQTILKNKA